jgi:hypothetical protein
MRFAGLVALILLLVSCQPANPFADPDNVETWEFRPFYGELRFLIVEEGTDTPIPDAAFQVSDLRIEELKNGGSVKSDQEGRMVVHQLQRGITYWGAGPPLPVFTFSAPGYQTWTYSVEELASGTPYEPYSYADLPTTVFTDEVGSEIELPVYEITIRLALID